LEKEKSELVNLKYKLEEEADKKDAKVMEIEKELQKMKDEVDLRKLVEERLSKNLLQHENDSMEMA
jgi:hypothetical protein